MPNIHSCHDEATAKLVCRAAGIEDIRISWVVECNEYKFYKFEKKIPVSKVQRYAITGENYQKGRVKGVPYSAEVHLTKKGYVTDKKLYGPLVGKEYKRSTMLTFSIDWHDQDHWAYSPEKGEVYRVKMDANGDEVDRTVVRRNMFGYKPQAILGQILDGEIRNVPNQQEGRRIAHDIVNKALPWSVEMDGKNILAILLTHPKMTYEEVVNIIKNEGGSVDKAGIIHRA